MVGVSGLTVAAVSASSSDSLPATSLPDPVRSGIDVPGPAPLEHSRHVARWASVRRAVTARRGPSPAAPGVATIGTHTPEGTENIVQVLGRARRAAGRLWVRARLPVLPNGTVGWVPRRALGGLQPGAHPARG